MLWADSGRNTFLLFTGVGTGNSKLAGNLKFSKKIKQGTMLKDFIESARVRVNFYHTFCGLVFQ